MEEIYITSFIREDDKEYLSTHVVVPCCDSPCKEIAQGL